MTDVTPGSTGSSDTSNCVNCGAWLGPGAVVCDICGRPTGQVTSVQQPPVPPVPGVPGAYAQPPPMPPAGYVPTGHAMSGYPRKTNGNAIASLVCSIVGLFICPIVFSILAIHLGGKARREVRFSWGRQGGDSMAMAGQIIGWIGLVLGAITVFFLLGR